MTRAETQERRLEIWRLHLTGLNEGEISCHLKIDKSAVSRHLKYAREHNSWTGRTHRDLYAEITRELYDVARQTRQEAYTILYDPSNKNRPEIKLGAISRIQVTTRALNDLRPDLELMVPWEEVEELSRSINGKRRTRKVSPWPEIPEKQPEMLSQQSE